MNIKNFLLIVLLFFCVCNKHKEKYIYLVKPKDILGILPSSFNCYDRNWYFDESLKPKKMNGILYLNFIGTNKDSIDLYISENFEVEEKEKSIYFTGKSNIVLQLKDEINKKIFIHSEIGTNEFLTYKQTINLYKKSKILIKLPKKGKLINHFLIYFTGEKGIIGIKSIYMK